MKYYDGVAAAAMVVTNDEDGNSFS